ncbi:addiction module toxin RelE [Candidatus Woesearchaeota archaeon]|nr:addiction module toxin RelE [Candidatus Woesearchaeota archaeon]
MRDSVLQPKLLKILKKLKKKDLSRLLATKKKIHEIRSSPNPHHYKNLRHDLKEFKRVRVDIDFILLFKVTEDLIVFETLLHHKKAYKRR